MIVNQPARFDASRSYDKDGTITSYVWDFGDGESGFGLTPTHTYIKSGSYKVKLFVMDDNLSTTWPPTLVGGIPVASEVTDQNEFSVMQITVLENRPDLFVESVTFSDEHTDESTPFTVTAKIRNGTSQGIAGGLHPLRDRSSLDSTWTISIKDMFEWKIQSCGQNERCCLPNDYACGWSSS